MSTLTRAATVGATALLVTVGATLPADAADPAPPDPVGPVNGPLVFEAVDWASQTVQIYRVGPGGGGLKPLTQAESAGDWNECPSWSPGGRRVFYDSANRAAVTAPQIMRMSATGTNNTVVSQDPEKFNACPDVSPNGRWIAFLQYGKSNFGEIGFMRSNGSQATTLLARKNTGYFNPQFSPDGKWLSVEKAAYTQQGQIRRADIVIVNLRTRTQTNLTKPGKASYGGNGWDPNGKGLVSIKNEKSLVRLFVNGADEKLVRTVRGKGYLDSPTFAPDRSRIAYLRCAPTDCGDPDLQNSVGSIWTVKKNGTKAKAIYTGSFQTIQPSNKLDWGVKPPS